MPILQVTYKIKGGIPVEEEVPEYPTLGISLGYEAKKLRTIQHRFEVGKEIEHEERLRRSERSLRLFLELLEYGYGLPISFDSRHSERIGDEASTGEISISAKYAIARAVHLPSEDILNTSSIRLQAWLRNANDARDTSSDAEAVRLYYAIIEDMKGRPGNNADASLLELKYITEGISLAMEKG